MKAVLVYMIYHERRAGRKCGAAFSTTAGLWVGTDTPKPLARPWGVIGCTGQLRTPGGGERNLLRLQLRNRS